LTGEIRDSCTPIYSISPCQGDCNTASQLYTKVPDSTGFLCPTGPNSYSVDCKSSMPCKCYLKDLLAEYPQIAEGGAVTCGGCDTLTSGNVCVFYCANGNPMTVPDQFGVLRPGGLFSSVPCTNQGWPRFDQQTSFTLPLCPIRPEECPPVLGINAQGTSLGFAPNVKAPSVCIGATESNVCTVSCAPSFYSPENRFVATCTRFMRNGIQVLDWLPWNENTIYGHQQVCQCQGCRAWFLDTRNSCECQVNNNYTNYC
jgi:hypothetical protein